MSTLFEYDKTEVEEGYYILRISLQDSELIIAEYLSGSWYQPGADYDVWRWSSDPMPKIEIICGLDLDKIAVAAEAEEPLSPVDSREGLDPQQYRAVHDAAIAAYEENTPPDHRYSATALRKAVDAALLAAKEQQP